MPRSEEAFASRLFFTIEGGEGTGKTTVATELVQRLRARGYEVLFTREPGGSHLAEQIRTLLLDPRTRDPIKARAELFLFLAARAQHVEEQILPALRQGQLVLCDRFNDSSIAYQGFARHLGEEYVERACRLATEGLGDPCCTLLLDLDPVEGLQRVRAARGRGEDRIEKEELPFHQMVRQGYLHLADRYPERILVLDASRPVSAVVEEAFAKIEGYLPASPRLL